mmetsp:Transcript_5722/g.16902  ORF Transcript_5722/g.16902 Transcript_5722/m.16902 type:complete len:143 (+) Transcript_5722:3-431(+)
MFPEADISLAQLAQGHVHGHGALVRSSCGMVFINQADAQTVEKMHRSSPCSPLSPKSCWTESRSSADALRRLAQNRCSRLDTVKGTSSALIDQPVMVKRRSPMAMSRCFTTHGASHVDDIQGHVTDVVESPSSRKFSTKLAL